MAKLRIQPHGRLQEWVAHENGYFKDEGLDYEFKMAPHADPDGGAPLTKDTEVLEGAYELYQQGGGSKGVDACDISSACHWAVNQASAASNGRMWGRAYSVTPSGVYVPPESDIRTPEQLAGVEIAVGYHSGSHFTTLQSLEVFVDPKDIKLRFIGRPMARLDAALDRAVPAVSAWGMAQSVLEQQAFIKVVDATFMIGFMFPTDVDDADAEKFMNAMRRAQMAIDLHPERYKHYYLKELPERFHDKVDVRRFGNGERIVFLPYSEEMYKETQRWMEKRGLFEDGASQTAYQSAVRS